jgi:hypothetical protein
MASVPASRYVDSAEGDASSATHCSADRRMVACSGKVGAGVRGWSHGCSPGSNTMGGSKQASTRKRQLKQVRGDNTRWEYTQRTM